VPPRTQTGARVPGAPLREATTFQLGGPCRFRMDCDGPDSLLDALRTLASEGLSPLVIGGGSNLLVSDAGLDAPVIRYAKDALEPRRDGDSVEVEGCAPLAALADWSVEEGLEGLVFATGIPGTVGGGIAGNAGAFGEQMADRLLALRVADGQGRVRDAAPGDFDFRYRSSRFRESGEVVVSARFALRPGDRGALRAERDRILAFRRERHPDWTVLPTAGSFFRNIEPTSAAERRQAAGWFLEQAGALEMRVGGAGLFPRHANMIVKADASCTARDVLDLSRRMAEAVWERFRLRLVPEVRILGEFP
jgi:UDP-N-acetylmuramate dehydrogenase